MNRIIKTDLKGKHAEDICKAIIGQMSDGYWENTPSYEKYWRCISVKKLNGKVAFNISDEPYIYSYSMNKYIKNAFFHMTDCEVLSFIAHKIQFICNKELASKGMKVKGSYKKFRNEKSTWLSYHDDITVDDIENVYIKLMTTVILNGIAESSCD